MEIRVLLPKANSPEDNAKMIPKVRAISQWSFRGTILIKDGSYLLVKASRRTNTPVVTDEESYYINPLKLGAYGAGIKNTAKK